MTNEEAVKCIEDVLNSDYYYDESLGYQLTSDDFEWLEKAKEGLKKQIPKKPSETDKARCICCACVVKRDERFCKNCGQALKWRDTE